MLDCAAYYQRQLWSQRPDNLQAQIIMQLLPHSISGEDHQFGWSCQRKACYEHGLSHVWHAIPLYCMSQASVHRRCYMHISRHDLGAAICEICR